MTKVDLLKNLAVMYGEARKNLAIAQKRTDKLYNAYNAAAESRYNSEVVTLEKVISLVEELEE